MSKKPTMSGGKRNQISVKLDDKEFEILFRIATEQERPLGWIARKLIEEGIEKMVATAESRKKKT